MLKNFAKGGVGKAQQLYAFDKTTDRSFLTSVENVAVQRDFNSLTSGQVSWEEPLSALEAAAAPLLNKIIQSESVAGITDGERVLLCLFVAVQFVRGVDYRERYKDLVRSLSDWTEDMAPNVPLPEQLVAAGQEEAVREFALSGLRKAPHIGKLLEEKDLLLLKTPPGCRFMLGDAPTTLQNGRDFGPYGNLGLTVPGIEVYFPISSFHQLAFWCPSLLQQMVAEVAELEAALKKQAGVAVLIDPVQRERAAAAVDQGRVRLNDAKAATGAARSGEAIVFSADHVMRLNSLQIRFAERWVFSNADDFSLAVLMIKDDPSVSKGGLRASFG